jgi:hypothetical protein
MLAAALSAALAIAAQLPGFGAQRHPAALSAALAGVAQSAGARVQDPNLSSAAARGVAQSAGARVQDPNVSSVATGASAQRAGASTARQRAGHGQSGSRSGVAGGALFGGSVPLSAETGKLHRKLAIVRVYFRIGQKFTRYDYTQQLDAGSTLLVSLDSPPRGGPTYAAIAAGRYDGEIRAFLRGVNQAAVTHHLAAIYVCFEHEANLPGHRRLGSPAEFVRAWHHVHALAHASRLNWRQGGRLHWVLILMQEAYVPRARQPGWARNEGQAASYWPGRWQADIVAADGYNSGGCRSVHVPSYRAPGRAVTSPEALFGPVVAFARAHNDAPVFVSEWGTVPYKVTSVAPGYVGSMQRFVAANRDVAAELYWDARGSDSCNYTLRNYPATLSALAAMGHSPRLQGHLAR